MVEFTQATYQDGQLTLKRKLSEGLEGKTLNIIILSEEASFQKREAFLNFVDNFAFTLPADYLFNRDELHAR